MLQVVVSVLCCSFFILLLTFVMSRVAYIDKRDKNTWHDKGIRAYRYMFHSYLL
jgi:hypothetical protein